MHTPLPLCIGVSGHYRPGMAGDRSLTSESDIPSHLFCPFITFELVLFLLL